MEGRSGWVDSLMSGRHRAGVRAQGSHVPVWGFCNDRTIYSHGMCVLRAAYGSGIWRSPGESHEEPGSISAMLQSVLLWLLLKINENLLLCRASQMVLVVKNLPPNAGDIRDVGSIPGWGRPPGGGHSNPLQYSCLENPMGRGAWWAAIQRVAKSWIWLSHLAGMHALLYSFLG